MTARQRWRHFSIVFREQCDFKLPGHVCWADIYQLKLNTCRDFKAMAAMRSQRQEWMFGTVTWRFLMLISVSLGLRLLLLSLKETEQDINSTCVAKKWALRLSFRSFPTSEKISLRNRAFLAAVDNKDRLFIQTPSSRDVRNRAPPNTHVCGLSEYIIHENQI